MPQTLATKTTWSRLTSFEAEERKNGSRDAVVKSRGSASLIETSRPRLGQKIRDSRPERLSGFAKLPEIS